MASRTAVLVSLLFFSGMLRAASLSAIVKDPSGGVVAGATIVADGKSTLQTVTDAQGSARFEELPVGSYHMTVVKDGFETWQRTIVIADKPAELSVFLKLKINTAAIPAPGKKGSMANADANYAALRGGKLNKVYSVENLVLARDAGTFTFRSGSFSFQPPVLGHVAAGVFVGNGNFQLKPGSEIAVKHLHFLAGVDAVNEDFTALVVYFTDSTFEEVTRNAELIDATPKRQEEAFQRVKDVIEFRREEPSTLFSHGDPPPRILTRLESILYRIDPPPPPRHLSLLERVLNSEDIPNYEAEMLAEIYNSQTGSFRAFLRGKEHSDLRFLLNPHGAIPMISASEEVAVLNYDPFGKADGVWYLAHLGSEVQAGAASSHEDKRLIAPEHYRLQVSIRAPTSREKRPT